MIGEKFQSYDVQITGSCICKSEKEKLDIFTNVPQKKPSIEPFHQPQGRESYLFPPENVSREYLIMP